ncbi:MAG TPA: hypothetical protein VKN18_11910 [Blastocatellia bacterium]|nr:hypothetical protein [Blastocatellia bacterium]
MATKREQIEPSKFEELDADQLKDSVREMLLLMNPLERELFIKTLQYEMFRSGLNISAYLIPLGIPARCAEELTPSEVGHLMRFFKINVPSAVPALARVLDECPVIATGFEQMSAWLLKAMSQEAWSRNNG